MAQRQDSTSDTGISVNDRGNSSSARAKERKAHAALSLRIAGASWDEIAQALGFPTPRSALVATERALEDELSDDSSRDQMRKMAGKRLERMLRAVWAKAIDENHPEQMQAVQRAKELIDRHAKLFGLDAPTEFVVSSPSASQLEAWVAQVTQADRPPVDEADILDGEVVDEEGSRALSS